MRIATGNLVYDWVENWAAVPEDESAQLGWAHHGIAVTSAGEVVTFHPGEPTVLVFSRAGEFLRSWSAPVVEAHGMAVAQSGSEEYLWIADPGAKRTPRTAYEYEPAARKGQTIAMGLDGHLAVRLSRPDHSAYQLGTYSPTSVTVFQERDGGYGDIWVADGYGESLVHRYNRDGEYLDSISGEEGHAGQFSCPHAVFLDTRKAEPELYIADRSNMRVQVYAADGEFKRVFGSEFLTSPSAFATDGNHLFIAELRGRLAVVDIDDRLEGYLGEHPVIARTDPGGPGSLQGWPNRHSSTGAQIQPSDLEPGRFNSPHGVAVDNEGHIYVVEWLIGGRYTKLLKIY